MTFRLEPQTIPKGANIDLCTFSNEPLLLRMDMATYEYYSALTDTRDKKLMEIASRAANVNVQTRPAGKKELKKFEARKDLEAVRNVRLKYETKQEQIAQLGTFDMRWGLRWLLSFVVLVEEPVLGLYGAERMVSVTEEWMRSLARADIYEVSNQLPQLMSILETARVELPLSLALAEKLPGNFNLACSLLFAGQLRSAHTDMYKPRWVLMDHQADSDDESEHEDAEISKTRARETIDGIVPTDAECTRSRPVDLRIASVDVGTENCPAGGYMRVSARIFDRSRLADNEDEEQVELRFEADMASCVCVGFVIEATLHTLSNGVHYIDAVTMVWPSYSPLDYVDGC
ncbi:hypothetical protein LPJ64_005497 [Coemansia asiatica]|uniref:Uncharacterized protein n=1 Tax=Coemansia asiatica TaxID=1052880 RepID=A0A9W8CI12_9FUNG|nr:hypothetical protein LPJ64_005497 [Coemansia asiatica]KAJ2858825.1 hypothetical protein FB639_005879 [Coemansia asiatica]